MNPFRNYGILLAAKDMLLIVSISKHVAFTKIKTVALRVISFFILLHAFNHITNDRF